MEGKGRAVYNCQKPASVDRGHQSPNEKDNELNDTKELSRLCSECRESGDCLTGDSHRFHFMTRINTDVYLNENGDEELSNHRIDN